MVSHSGLITVMQKAARKAAPRLRRDFNEVEQLQVSRKGPADFVSMADKQAERTILEELRHARPDWRLTLEEGGSIEGDPDKPRFIVDPLDGTSNFLHGLPHFAISIAVEDPRGAGGRPEITQALIYQPLTDESFWAEKGRGAWLNERRLRVSARRDLADALIATGVPWKGPRPSRPLPEDPRRRRPGGRRDPPLRLGRARSRLGGGGPLRRLLGGGPPALGRRRRNPPGARGGRLRHRLPRRRLGAREGAGAGGQRPAPFQASQAGGRSAPG
jgi:fructose-1,6-bisphosphatase/inositol monophosphatase family enzyme